MSSLPQISARSATVQDLATAIRNAPLGALWLTNVGLRDEDHSSNSNSSSSSLVALEAQTADVAAVFTPIPDDDDFLTNVESINLTTRLAAALSLVYGSRGSSSSSSGSDEPVQLRRDRIEFTNRIEQQDEQLYGRSRQESSIFTLARFDVFAPFTIRQESTSFQVACQPTNSILFMLGTLISRISPNNVPSHNIGMNDNVSFVRALPISQTRDGSNNSIDLAEAIEQRVNSILPRQSKLSRMNNNIMSSSSLLVANNSSSRGNVMTAHRIFDASISSSNDSSNSGAAYNFENDRTDAATYMERALQLHAMLEARGAYDEEEDEDENRISRRSSDETDNSGPRQ